MEENQLLTDKLRQIESRITAQTELEVRYKEREGEA